MQKIAITLKIVQIDEKSIFFPIIFFAKRQGSLETCPGLRIQTLDNFYIPSLASKLLLKEVICKKNRQKRLFSTKSSTYHDFFRIS